MVPYFEIGEWVSIRSYGWDRAALPILGQILSHQKTKDNPLPGFWPDEGEVFWDYEVMVYNPNNKTSGKVVVSEDQLHRVKKTTARLFSSLWLSMTGETLQISDEK